MKNFLFSTFTTEFGWVCPFFGWVWVGVTFFGGVWVNVGKCDHFLTGCGCVWVSVTFFLAGCGWVQMSVWVQVSVTPLWMGVGGCRCVCGCR